MDTLRRCAVMLHNILALRSTKLKTSLLLNNRHSSIQHAHIQCTYMYTQKQDYTPHTHTHTHGKNDQTHTRLISGRHFRMVNLMCAPFIRLD